MSEPTIQQNVEQGRGIVDKSPFRVVGANKKDLETGGHIAEERGPGRPPIDKTWTQVGKDVKDEQR